jgi:hypothetical protein
MTKEELADCEREMLSFLGKYCADHNLEHKLPQPNLEHTLPQPKPDRKSKRVRRKQPASSLEVEAAIILQKMKYSSTPSANVLVICRDCYGQDGFVCGSFI